MASATLYVKTLFLNSILEEYKAIHCKLGKAEMIVKCDIERIRDLFNESEGTFATYDMINTLIEEKIISVTINVTVVKNYDNYEIRSIDNITVRPLQVIGRPEWARYLKDIHDEPTKKFPFLIKGTVYYLATGRLNSLFAVSGSGKTYYATKNSSYYVKNNVFDLVVYINLELPSGELKARFAQSSSSGEVMEDKIIVVDKRDVTSSEIIKLLEFEKIENKRIFIVIDNGDNILLNINDTARTGLRQFANDLHNWLSKEMDCSALWLGQVDREGIGELFNRHGEFVMGLQHTKTSSGLYEISHTVIGMAQKEEGRYDSLHSKALKNGGNT